MTTKNNSVIQEHMREALAKHEIKEFFCKPLGEYHIFHLKSPGRSMYQCWLTFLPTGIVITGDLRITNAPALGSREYKDMQWFAGDLSPDYLAGKFLTQRWIPDLAAEALQWRVQAMIDEGRTDSASRLKTIIDDLKHGAYDEARDLEEDIGFLHLDETPGYGYDPAEVGWLCALQEKFAELYDKMPTV